jgi:hypothetical protein
MQDTKIAKVGMELIEPADAETAPGRLIEWTLPHIALSLALDSLGAWVR